MKTDHLRAVATDLDGTERPFFTTGQIARTLKALVDAGAHGITSLDIAATWALRTSHYVFVLRRDHGLEIETMRESHTGPAGKGWHGRYRLLTSVRLLDEPAEATEAA